MFLHNFAIRLVFKLHQIETFIDMFWLVLRLEDECFNQVRDINLNGLGTKFVV